MRHAILYGGGLDSTALIPYVKERITLLGAPNPRPILIHVDYGQKAVEAERDAAAFFSVRYDCELLLGNLDMSFSRAKIMKGVDGVGATGNDNRLELRNPLLIMYAASLLASTQGDAAIYLGFHQEPEGAAFPDARMGFIEPLGLAIHWATNTDIRLLAPFSNLTRQDIVERAAATDMALIEKSHTCYEAATCHQCLHCKEKATMLTNLGLNT